MSKKPFKGCKEVELKGGVPFPCALSFKIDGFRCMVYDGRANSSSAKEFPNRYTHNIFVKAASILDGLDGELCAGEPNDKNLMQQCTSAFNSIEGEPDFTWWVFDDFSDLSLDFEERYANYQRRVEEGNDHLEAMGLPRFLRPVEYRMIHNQEEYDAMKQEASDLCYEGLYGKSWKGKYKHGRSTPVQRSCWKSKPWTDEEGQIVDFVEMEENTNEAFTDELGRTKRSTHQEGLVGKGMLGSYVVINPKYCDSKGQPIPFRVSCGSMTMEERERRWASRDSERGQIITYKFFDFGIVDVPRSAIYKSHRPDFDL
jgi:DNA ligase-1